MGIVVEPGKKKTYTPGAKGCLEEEVADNMLDHEDEVETKPVYSLRDHPRIRMKKFPDGLSLKKGSLKPTYSQTHSANSFVWRSTDYRMLRK